MLQVERLFLGAPVKAVSRGRGASELADPSQRVTSDMQHEGTMACTGEFVCRHIGHVSTSCRSC